MLYAIAMGQIITLKYRGKYSDFGEKDLVWEMARVSGDDDSCVPAWSGFNAFVSNNSIPAAKIRYLPFSNTSPSDLSTIFTTLLRLVETEQELGQHHNDHILVTVDSNIEQGTTDPLGVGQNR